MADWKARYLSKEKAPSSEVPSVFCRSSAEKGTENVIFIEKLFKIMRRVPKWCLAAAKGSKNMILEQTWCQKDAKWTKNYPKVVQNQQTYHKMMPKGYQSAPKRAPKRARALQKASLRKSIDCWCIPGILLEPFLEHFPPGTGRHFSRTTLLDLVKCMFFLRF